MPVQDLTRAERMGERLVRTARSRGGDIPTLQWLRFAHSVATGPRAAAFDDDHDPRFLHPGRSALILMLDLNLLSPVPLGLALWHESEEAHLAPSEAVVRQALSGAGERSGAAAAKAEPTDPSAAHPGLVEVAEQVLEQRATLPRSGDEDLAERLLELDPEPAAAALAERLDHLRHLHLRAVTEQTRAIWQEAHDVWSPIAGRTHPDLARRYQWWVRKFRGRYT